MFAISKLKSKFAQNLKINRMKKLIIVSVIAAFFAACGNKNNDSAAKVDGLDKWVDSVKTVAMADTAPSQASWEGWNATYTENMNGINMEGMDEASKSKLEATKTKWAEVGTSYTQMITDKAAKEAEMKAAMDTMNKAAEPGMDGKEMKKEEEKK